MTRKIVNFLFDLQFFLLF